MITPDIKKQIEENPELQYYIDTYGFKMSPSKNLVYSLDKSQLITQYKLIQSKLSPLSSSQRKSLVDRVNWNVKQGIISQDEII